MKPSQTSSKSFFASINGQLRSGSKVYEIINPFDGKPFATAPDCSASDVDDAVAAARAAFPSWSKTSWDERRTLIRKCGGLLQSNRDDIAALLTREQGKTFKQAVGELFGCQARMDATLALESPNEPARKSGKTKILKKYLPIGVVACIVPWNFPLLLMHFKLFQALLAGCCVVMKPSEYVPLSTLEVARLYNTVLPPGVFNCISSSSPEIGRTLVEHPGIDKISFTGSTQTGVAIVQSSAPSLKRVTLELGGNDPAIVLPDCNPETVAKVMLMRIFLNSGQVCIAIKRIFVHESIYDRFCAALGSLAKKLPVGDGMKPDVMLGPLTNEMQYTKAREMLVDAVNRGATLVHSEIPPPVSETSGYIFKPVVLNNVKEGFRVVDEEQFAPIAPVMSYKTVDEAVKRANDSNYGLGASVWTSDMKLGEEVASRIQAGSVWVNDHGMIIDQEPFGGAKQSGVGVEGGKEGLLEFMQLHVIRLKDMEKANL